MGSIVIRRTARIALLSVALFTLGCGSGCSTSRLPMPDGASRVPVNGRSAQFGEAKSKELRATARLRATDRFIDGGAQ